MSIKSQIISDSIICQRNSQYNAQNTFYFQTSNSVITKKYTNNQCVEINFLDLLSLYPPDTSILLSDQPDINNLIHDLKNVKNPIQGIQYMIHGKNNDIIFNDDIADIINALNEDLSKKINYYDKLRSESYAKKIHLLSILPRYFTNFVIYNRTAIELNDYKIKLGNIMSTIKAFKALHKNLNLVEIIIENEHEINIVPYKQ